MKSRIDAFRSRSLAVGMLVLASVPAWATDDTPNYATQAGLVKDGMTAVYNAVLPVGVGMLLIFITVNVFKRLIKTFTH